MPLPTTGPISFADVREELGRSSGPISLGDADVRSLAGRPSGAISLSDLRGKSSHAGISVPQYAEVVAGGYGWVHVEIEVVGNTIYWRKSVTGQEPLNTVRTHTWNANNLPRGNYEICLFRGDGAPPIDETWKDLGGTGPIKWTWDIDSGLSGSVSGFYILEIRAKNDPDRAVAFGEIHIELEKLAMTATLQNTSITKGVSGVSLPQFIEFGFLGASTNTFRIRMSDNTTQDINWNPNSLPRTYFRVRVNGSGSLPEPIEGLGFLYEPSTDYMFRWERGTVGVTSGQVTIQIYNAFTGELLWTSTLSATVERQSYGIFLPSVPTSVYTTGTTNRYVSLNFRGLPPYEVIIDRTEGEVGEWKWNPNDHPPTLFETRLVHTSGTAPTGSAVGNWIAAGGLYTWRWDRNTVGTTSGGTRLEIREKATGNILAQSNFSATLNMQASYTQHTMSYARWQAGDDKVRFYYQGFDGLAGQGSLSPTTTVKGATISTLFYIEGIQIMQISLSGNYAKNFFSRVEVVGVGNFYTADAPIRDETQNPWGYSVVNGITYWQWPAISSSPFGAARTIRIHP